MLLFGTDLGQTLAVGRVIEDGIIAEAAFPGLVHLFARGLYDGFDLDVIRNKGKQSKYHRKNVSFGVAEYYYDYSF